MEWSQWSQEAALVIEQNKEIGNWADFKMAFDEALEQQLPGLSQTAYERPDIKDTWDTISQFGYPQSNPAVGLVRLIKSYAFLARWPDPFFEMYAFNDVPTYEQLTNGQYIWHGNGWEVAADGGEPGGGDQPDGRFFEFACSAIIKAMEEAGLVTAEEGEEIRGDVMERVAWATSNSSTE